MKGYQARGYDIYSDDGKLIEPGAGKTVSYAKYKQALDKIKELWIWYTTFKFDFA